MLSLIGLKFEVQLLVTYPIKTVRWRKSLEVSLTTSPPMPESTFLLRCRMYVGIKRFQSLDITHMNEEMHLALSGK